MQKYYLAIVTAMVTGIGILKLSKPPQSKETSLVIGLQSGYPPFEYKDAQGNIVGFDVDIAKLIAEKMQKNLVLEDMEFDSEILALKQGKIDLIISGMNITPEREKEILMVPYYKNKGSSLSLIFWKKIPQGVHSIQDVTSIAVGTGTVADNYLIKKYPTISKTSFDGSLACLMDVKYGKSMANLVESDVAKYLKTKHPEVVLLNVPLSSEETIESYGIGIHKNNDSLFQQIKKVIQDLKESGELETLENSWFTYE